MTTSAAFIAWLETQKPKPPNQKEKDRMKAAIEYDLEHACRYLRISKEARMKTFSNLGYLYD